MELFYIKFEIVRFFPKNDRKILFRSEGKKLQKKIGRVVIYGNNIVYLTIMQHFMALALNGSEKSCKKNFTLFVGAIRNSILFMFTYESDAHLPTGYSLSDYPADATTLTGISTKLSIQVCFTLKTSWLAYNNLILKTF